MIFLGFLFILFGIVGIFSGLHEWEELIVTVLCIVIGAVILNYYWR